MTQRSLPTRCQVVAHVVRLPQTSSHRARQKQNKTLRSHFPTASLTEGRSMFFAISNRPSLAGFIHCLLANIFLPSSQADTENLPIKHRLVLTDIAPFAAAVWSLPQPSPDFTSVNSDLRPTAPVTAADVASRSAFTVSGGHDRRCAPKLASMRRSDTSKPSQNSSCRLIISCLDGSGET